MAVAQERPRPLTTGEIAASVQRICVAAHETARMRGYYQGGPRNVAESIALATRELGHAVNDVRKGRALGEIRHDARGKPRGFGVAIARCVIRLSDLCAANGVNLGEAMATEMAYNASRVKRG